jgi:hypothetical protein
LKTFSPAGGKWERAWKIAKRRQTIYVEAALEGAVQAMAAANLLTKMQSAAANDRGRGDAASLRPP